jgi:hypothetical protein
MVTTKTWRVLIGLVLIAAVVWLIAYFGFGLFRHHVVLTLSIAIIAAFFGSVFRWAITQGAMELSETGTVAVTLVSGAISAAIVLGVVGSTPPAPSPPPLSTVTEPVLIDCAALRITNVFEEVNAGENIFWSIYNPGRVLVTITFASTYPGSMQISSTYASFTDVAKKDGYHKYSVKCGTTPINTGDTAPMIQIPRRH